MPQQEGAWRLAGRPAPSKLASKGQDSGPLRLVGGLGGEQLLLVAGALLLG